MSLIQALRGSQNMPGVQGGGAPQTPVAPTDVVGPIMAKYQAEMAKYQADQAKQNAMMGALFGLGGSALGGWASGGFPGWLK